MNLGKALSRASCHFKNRRSLFCAKKARTFKEIEENSNRFINGLFNLGIKKKDRVAIFSDNCVEYVEIDFALYKGGIIRVGINPLLSPREVKYIINDSGANTVIVSSRLFDQISSIMAHLPKVKNYISVSKLLKTEKVINYHDFIRKQNANFPKISIKDKDLAMLFYTGGTTGIPKGAMHTNESVFNVVMNMQSEYLHLNRTDKLLSGGSLAHANGFRAILCFLEGATFVIPKEFRPKNIIKIIKKEKISILCTVPTTLIRLIDFPSLKKSDLKSLKLITYGAAPMPYDKLKEIIKKLGNRLAQSYGQAEALMAISHLSKEDHILSKSKINNRRLTSAGIPYSGIDVEVVNDRGKRLKPGEVGEIIVKGKITMKGYWNNSKATAETKKAGWIYTGDIGFIDENGYVYLVDRKKDVIISGGYNIYAREVEDALYEHPAIKEAAVIGVPDDEWGESVKAIIKLNPGMKVTEKEIIEFCKSKLSSFKKPKTINFVKNLPKTSIGKISKKELRKEFWKGIGRSIN